MIDRLASQMRAQDFAAGWRVEADKNQLHEAARLQLDCRKAHEELGWRPKLDPDAALALTAEWYRAQIAGVAAEALFDLTSKQIEA